MAKGYNFGSSARRVGGLRHMKTLFRKGLGVASGNFPAGSKVRFKHSPGGRR